ncbi:MAG: DMT family transporter [Sinobacteraceae bacterium]|nr:DMT family transporter [Nevskiaceae bacterium]
MSAGQERAAFALFAGAVCIGLAPILVRLADVGLTAAAFWRAALALPALAALRLHAPAEAPHTATADRRALWLAGAFFGADLAVWHQSLGHTSVANATLLANLAPVFVALALWWLDGERYGMRFWLGLAAALAGAGLLVADSLSIGLRDAFGDGLAAISAVFYAGYQIVVARVRSRCDTITVMLRTSFVTALLLLPVALALHEALWPQTLRGWSVVLGLALVSHVAGQGLIAYALAELPTAFASVGLLVQPLAAAAFAWALLGERFGIEQALGGTVVLTGIALCRLATAPRAATMELN